MFNKEFLKSRMKELGITLENMIDLLHDYGIDLTIDSLKAYRIGRADPRLKTVSAFADILQCTEVDFFDNSEVKREKITKETILKNPQKYNFLTKEDKQKDKIIELIYNLDKNDADLVENFIKRLS